MKNHTINILFADVLINAIVNLLKCVFRCPDPHFQILFMINFFILKLKNVFSFITIECIYCSYYVRGKNVMKIGLIISVRLTSFLAHTCTLLPLLFFEFDFYILNCCQHIVHYIAPTTQPTVKQFRK